MLNNTSMNNSVSEGWVFTHQLFIGKCTIEKYQIKKGIAMAKKLDIIRIKL